MGPQEKEVTATGSKSEVTFETYCPHVYLNGKHIPQDTTVKYLGISRSQTDRENTHHYQTQTTRTTA